MWTWAAQLITQESLACRILWQYDILLPLNSCSPKPSSTSHKKILLPGMSDTLYIRKISKEPLRSLVLGNQNAGWSQNNVSLHLTKFLFLFLSSLCTTAFLSFSDWTSDRFQVTSVFCGNVSFGCLHEISILPRPADKNPRSLSIPNQCLLSEGRGLCLSHLFCFVFGKNFNPVLACAHRKDFSVLSAWCFTYWYIQQTEFLCYAESVLLHPTDGLMAGLMGPWPRPPQPPWDARFSVITETLGRSQGVLCGSQRGLVRHAVPRDGASAPRPGCICSPVSWWSPPASSKHLGAFTPTFLC